MYNVIVKTIAGGVDLPHVLQSKLAVSQKDSTNGCHLSVCSRTSVERKVRASPAAEYDGVWFPWESIISSTPSPRPMIYI